MVFPHLGLSDFSFHLLSGSIDFLSSNQTSASESQTNKELSSFPFFMPLFQEKDRILNEFYRAGICDAEGTLCSDFDFVNMPSLSVNSPELQHVFKTSQDFLHQSRQLDTQVLTTKGESQQLNIPLKLFDTLNNLIQKSQLPVPVYGQNGKISHFLPACPIEDIKLIGSEALKPLKEILLYTALQFFGLKIDPERIKQWFQMEHVNVPFNKETHDADLRILSSGDLTYQAYFSNQISGAIAASIKNFDHDFYINQLKLKNPTKYQQLNKKSSESSLKELSVLEFGGVIKRSLVQDQETRYAIIAVKTLNEEAVSKDIDFLLVSLNEEGKPTLKNLNLSTSNCWTFSLYNFFLKKTNDSNNNGHNDNGHHNNLIDDRTLKINTQPFKPAKALLDLICGCFTVLRPTVDTWIRFLRDCERSMQPKIEREMVAKVFEFKNDFVKQHKVLQSRTEVTDGEYIYHLLQKEIQHSQVNAQTQFVNPYTVIPFLFRTCLSLQTHSSFSDQDCATLWQLAATNGWLQTENSSTDSKIKMALALKKALIEEKIPFSVVSAWMGILAWGWAPLSATSHCQLPVFHLKHPLSCLLSIQPLENGRVLQQYFSQHFCPNAFQDLYYVMSSSHQTPLLDFPLIPYLNQLNIDPLDLKQLATDWLKHSSSFLNAIGLQLYLEITSLLPNKVDLVFIFQHLPRLLQQQVEPQQVKEILKALTALANRTSAGYQDALAQLDPYKHIPLKRLQWMSVLAQTKDPETLRLAYALWKDYKSDRSQNIKKHLDVGNTLYKSLCACQPHLALSLLRTFQDRHLLQSNQVKSYKMVSLIQAYQIYAPQQLVCVIDQILPLMASLFEQENPPKFNTEKQHNDFSQALRFFIETLYGHPFQQTTADDFLLQACRKKLFLDQAWQTHTWLRRLEKLVSDPQQTLFTYSLYHILCEENLWDVSLENSSRQQLHIALGKALLKQEKDALSLILFNQLSKKTVESSSDRPFYEWVLNLFHKQTLLPLNSCPAELFNTLLFVTSSPKRSDSHLAFYPFFQRLVNVLKFQPCDLKFSEDFSLTFFDEFLGNKNMFPIMQESLEEWQTLLLDYIEVSLSFSSVNRFPALWQVYTQLLRSFNKTPKTSTQVLRLFKLLVVLLQHASSTLYPFTPDLSEWMQKQSKIILDKFYENACVQEAKIFLLANDKMIPPGSFTHYVWWICKQELAAPPPSSILRLLDLDNFENLKTQISPVDYSLLPKVTKEILDASPPRPAQAWTWLEWCLKLSETKELFESEKIKDDCLTCAAQFIAQQDYTQALAVLASLPILSLIQQEKASAQWMQIVSHFHSNSSLDRSRKLFLNTQILALCPHLTDQLRPFVPSIIQRHLLQMSFENTAKVLVLDLSQTYGLKEASSWLSLWKTVETGQEADGVLQIWKIFKSQSAILTGTEVDIAHCWTLAFVCLQKINHLDLLDYFDQQDWLKNFKDPLTLHLKWKALEAVFLRAVQVLDPHAFNSDFFKLLIDKKLNILIPLIDKYEQEARHHILQKNIVEEGEFKLFFKQLLESKPELNLYPEIPLAGEWNRTIELALSNHLHRSQNCECLLEILTLLYSQLETPSNLVHDPVIYASYLDQFGKIVSTYLTLEDAPLTEINSYQLLSKHIAQIIKVLSAPDVGYMAPYLSLLTAFLNKPTALHLEIVIQLITKIFNQKEVKNVETLKSPLLVLLPLLFNKKHLLEFKLIDLPRLALFENYLKIAFRFMEFSLLEKSELSYHFLRASYDYRLYSEKCEWNDNFVVDMLNLYIEWGPYLFAQPKNLRIILKKISLVILPYGNAACQDQHNQNIFTYCLTQILNVHDHTKLTTAPIYQESLKNYFSWVIYTIKKLGSEPKFLLDAFKTYISAKIGDAFPRKMEASKIIALLHEFFHLYPPEPPQCFGEPDFSGNRKFKNSPHLSASQELLDQAYQKNIFKGYTPDLINLQLWVSYVPSETAIQKEHRPLFENTLQKFLDYKSPYGVSRAIQVCYLIQKFLTPPQETKSLIPLYEKILLAMRPHIKCIIQHDERNISLLFDYLDGQTRVGLFNHNIKARQYICEVAQLYFKFALETVESLINDPNEAPFQAHYLHNCFQLLKEQAIHGAFETSYSSYLAHLEKLLLLIKKVEVQYAYHPIRSSELVMAKPKNLFREWIEALVVTQHLTKTQAPLLLKNADKNKQRELLLHCFDLLINYKSDDNLYRVYESLLAILFIVLSPNKQEVSYWMSIPLQETTRLFESISQLFNTTQANARQKVTFEFYNLLFMDRSKIDYAHYLEKVIFIIDLLPQMELFQDQHPFSNFSQSLLKIVLARPDSDEEDYTLQRTEILLNFLTTMQPFFEQASENFILEAQGLLLKTLAGGIEQNLLQYEDPHAVEHMVAAKEWLTFSSSQLSSEFPSCHFTLLSLLELIFYKKQLAVDSATYHKNIKALTLPLCEYVLQTKDYNSSFLFIRLIGFLPVTPSQQFIFFALWLHTFPKLNYTVDEESAIYHHIVKLVQYVKDQKIFANIQMTDKSSSKSDKQPGSSSKLVTDKVTQSFIELLLKDIFKDNKV